MCNGKALLFHVRIIWCVSRGECANYAEKERSLLTQERCRKEAES